LTIAHIYAIKGHRNGEHAKPTETDMKTLDINATTTDAEIEAAIPFLDMRAFATERRDDAKAPYEAGGALDTVLTLHEIDGVTVLWDAEWACGYVNEMNPGVGDSLVIENDGAESPEDAAAQWKIA
jgi:hypothetical protein